MSERGSLSGQAIAHHHTQINPAPDLSHLHGTICFALKGGYPDSRSPSLQHVCKQIAENDSAIERCDVHMQDMGFDKGRFFAVGWINALID